MSDAEAIEEAIRRTGVERYRSLCSPENPHAPPNAAADYIRLMHAIAGGPAEAPAGPAPAAYDTSWLPGPCGGCR